MTLMLFLTVCSLITGWLSITSIQKSMGSSLNERFESTTNRINNVLNVMGESASDWANMLSKQPGWKLINNSNNPETANKLLDKYSASTSPRLILILDITGKVVIDSTREKYINRSLKDLPVFNETIKAASQQIYLTVLDGQLISLSSALIKGQHEQDSPVGVILVGFPIDATMLHQMKQDTDLDISIINRRQLLATTMDLSDAERANIRINSDKTNLISQQSDQKNAKSELSASYIHISKPLINIEPESTISLMLAYPREQYQASISHIHQQFKLFFLGGTIAALLIVLWFSREFLQSINKLSVGAEKIAKGDFTSRIEIETGDELQILADTFNTMVDTVESTNKTLSRYSSALEREVEVRTRDYRKEVQARSASERKIKSIIDNIVVGLLTTDENGLIELFNPAAEKMFGYSADEVFGKSVSMLMSSPHSELHDGYIHDYLSSGENDVVGSTREITGMRKDGTVFPHLISLTEMYILEQSPISNERVPRRHFIATMQDLTESKRTEEILRRANKMEALGQLTGGIAHDFNNLLGIIIGNLDLLEDECSEGDQATKHHIRSALKASLRGSDLTKSLLAFSRRSDPDTSPVNINLVIEGMRDMIEKSLTASISVETVLSDHLWYTDINPGELEDAIVNMAINSRDAMPNGGRFIIETENIITDDTFIEQHPDMPAGEYVLLTVSDTGQGISDELKDRIFEPFFTTKPTGQGTGLGIPMIYGFVNRSSGHIVLYSEPGTGTTFKIFLPHSIKKNKPDVVSSNISETNLNGNETILVVDDEQDLAMIAQNTLSKLGYKTYCANNATEALKLLSEHAHIDLLFTDVVMPGGMDGYALANEVAKLYPKTKVLLASGFTNKFHLDQQNYSKYGFLCKPYRKNELVERIRELFDYAT